MNLDPATIDAIACAVVAKLRAVESRQTDAAYLASLPDDELKRVMQERRRAAVAGMKSKGGKR